jgi:hypothetical protein
LKFNEIFIRLTSHSPFTADSESRLKDQIRKAEINTSSHSYGKLSPEGKEIFIACDVPSHKLPNDMLF